jgi:ferritin-like protein
MYMSSYHESVDQLSEKAKDISRALNSLKEEIEAVDWYNQRVDVTEDAELAHNRDEEIEHACMTLEWLRRNMDGWDDELKTYLFTKAPITEVEEAGAGSENSGLNIGKM